MDTTTYTFACLDCFDAATIDRGGREIACPYCAGGTRIPTKPSRAQVRPLGGHEVRYLEPTGETPFEGTTTRVIEVDGETVGWVIARGKAYGDPSLCSNFKIATTDRTQAALEAFTRDEAVAGWLARRSA